jgi:hypothetical protein
VGVSAIGLGFADTGADDGKGNAQARLGSFTRSDGTQGALGEYWLARNTAISVAESSMALPADVAGLPEVRGSGNVYDLRQAMARDAGLKDLVGAFVQESDGARRDELLEQIVFRCRADVLDPPAAARRSTRASWWCWNSSGPPFVGALRPDPVPDAARLSALIWLSDGGGADARPLDACISRSYRFTPRPAIVADLSGDHESTRNSPDPAAKAAVEFARTGAR